MKVKGYLIRLSSTLCHLNKLNLITKLNYISAFLSGWIMLGLIFYNNYATGARYLFNAPPRGSTEISTYLIPVTVFLALAHTLEMKKHIFIELFITRLKIRSQIVLNLMTTIFISIFAAILVWKGTELSIDKFHEYSSTDIILPLFPFYIFVPIGGLLLLLQSIRDIKTYLISLIKRNSPNTTNKDSLS